MNRYLVDALLGLGIFLVILILVPLVMALWMRYASWVFDIADR